MESAVLKTPELRRRRYFIGGSDARIIMGDDETALVRLWREKRCEVEPEEHTIRARISTAAPQKPD